MPNNWLEPITPPYGTDENGNRVTSTTGFGASNVGGQPRSWQMPYQPMQKFQPQWTNPYSQQNQTTQKSTNPYASQPPSVLSNSYNPYYGQPGSTIGGQKPNNSYANQPRATIGSAPQPKPQQPKTGYANKDYWTSILPAKGIQNTEQRYKQYNNVKPNIPPGSVGNVGYNKYAEAQKQKYNLGPGQKYQQFIKNGAIYAKNSADMKTLWQNYTALDNWPKAPTAQPQTGYGGYGYGYSYGGGGGYKPQAQPLDSVVWRMNQ